MQSPGGECRLLGNLQEFHRLARVRFQEVEVVWLDDVAAIRGAPSGRLFLYLLAGFEEFGLYLWAIGEPSKDFEQSVVCVSECVVCVFDRGMVLDQGCSLLVSSLFQSFTLQPFLYCDSKNIY